MCRPPSASGNPLAPVDARARALAPARPWTPGRLLAPMEDHRPALLGRSSERQVLDRLLENVRRGESAVRVIRGEAGVGKTALLRYAAEQAAGFRLVQIAGVE